MIENKSKQLRVWFKFDDVYWVSSISLLRMLISRFSELHTNTQQAWNAYPHCVTVLTNGYLAKEKFRIVIETMHMAGGPTLENAVNLTYVTCCRLARSHFLSGSVKKSLCVNLRTKRFSSLRLCMLAFFLLFSIVHTGFLKRTILWCLCLIYNW